MDTVGTRKCAVALIAQARAETLQTSAYFIVVLVPIGWTDAVMHEYV